MKKSKMITALLLCLALAAIFIACNDEKTNNPAAENPYGVNVTENPDGSDITVVDMKQKVFTFLTSGWGTGTGGGNLSADIVPEDLGSDPDPILQLAYERQIKIEQTYNVALKQVNFEDSSGAVTQYTNSILANDGAYDAAITTCVYFTPLVSGNYLVDWKDILTVDMDKPYWNSNFYEAMSILGRHYAADGDISKRRLECVWIMAFNKTLIVENGLESPFDLVKEQRWTYDMMHEMGKEVADDLNGDGKRRLADDLWGINYTVDSIMGIISASGVKIAETDGGGVPVLTVGSEINLAKLDKIYATMRDNTYSVDTLFNGLVGGGVGKYADAEIFVDGRCLFLAAATHNIMGQGGYNLRETDVDFGIIPYPKWDLTTPDYLPYTANNYHPVLTIPNTNRDLDNTGILLEAMAYEGMNTITIEFYESLLKRKTARDNASADMIDYIFGNLRYDVGLMYNLGGIGGLLGWDMSMNLRLNIVSQIESNTPEWQHAIDVMIEEIEKNR